MTDWAGSLTERHPRSQRFHDLLQRVGKMHDNKQADYGSDEDPFANVTASTEFGIEPWLGAVLRMNDKVTRLKTAAKGKQLKNESVVDSLLDIAVYSLIALVLHEELEVPPWHKIKSGDYVRINTKDHYEGLVFLVHSAVENDPNIPVKVYKSHRPDNFLYFKLTEVELVG